MKEQGVAPSHRNDSGLPLEEALQHLANTDTIEIDIAGGVTLRAEKDAFLIVLDMARSQFTPEQRAKIVRLIDLHTPHLVERLNQGTATKEDSDELYQDALFRKACQTLLDS
jgi:hypothetical protein